MNGWLNFLNPASPQTCTDQFVLRKKLLAKIAGGYATHQLLMTEKGYVYLVVNSVNGVGTNLNCVS